MDASEAGGSSPLGARNTQLIALNLRLGLHALDKPLIPKIDLAVATRSRGSPSQCPDERTAGDAPRNLCRSPSSSKMEVAPISARSHKLQCSEEFDAKSSWLARYHPRHRASTDPRRLYRFHISGQPACSTTTRMAQDDAGPFPGIRYIRADSRPGSAPRQRASISEMAPSRRSVRAPSTSQARAACREGTGTHSRTSDAERLRTARSK